MANTITINNRVYIIKYIYRSYFYKLILDSDTFVSNKTPHKQQGNLIQNFWLYYEMLV